MDRTTAWLRAQIAECSPGPGRSPNLADKLGSALESIWRGNGMVFGMVVPARLVDRDALVAEATAALHQWLPLIDDADTLHRIAEMARRTSLSIDAAPFLTNLEAAREAKRSARRAAAQKTEPRNEALERVIDERPDDPAGYSVLADWLEAHGSVRGALIHLGLRAEADPALEPEVASYLAAHRDALLGVFDEAHDDHLTWRRGYVHAAKLGGEDSIAAALEYLLQHPSGSRLVELSIGMNGESQEFDLSDVVKVLRAERPSHLRFLHLGDFEYPDDTEMSWYDVGDISALLPALPALTTLIVQGGSFVLGPIDLPALEHAEFRTGGLTSVSALAIANARWPKLRHLDVWYGGNGYGGDTTILDVRALLARGDLKELRHLGLMNSMNSDTICDLLATSPLAAQLEVIDLSYGTLGDEGVRALLGNRDRFPKLQRLIVNSTWVSDAAVAEVEAWGPTVIAESMNEPEAIDDRYVAVSE